jgi:hypothetical protein
VFDAGSLALQQFRSFTSEGGSRHKGVLSNSLSENNLSEQ